MVPSAIADLVEVEDDIVILQALLLQQQRAFSAVVGTGSFITGWRTLLRFAAVDVKALKSL